jgi:cyclic pyranopterin phosphate synthase
MLRDRRERPLQYLRISLTDRCNLRCTYCMPREHFASNHVFLPKSEILSYEEIAQLTASMIPLGLEKVRLTGGEPLLRRNIERLIEMMPKGVDLAMTTNGILLENMAQKLWDAGLKRVTVSLDAIDEDTFRKMADSDVSPAQVLAGIDAALEVGMKVKVNVVVKRGVNEHSVEEMVDYFANTGVIVRFIEFMDVGETNHWRLDDVVTGDQMREMLGELEEMPPQYVGEVARRFHIAGQEVGFIESVSRPFCGNCNRARISADGSLYTCLFASKGHDLRGLIRLGASDEQIAEAVKSIWEGRDDAYSELRGQTEKPRVEMSFIGG